MTDAVSAHAAPTPETTPARSGSWKNLLGDWAIAAVEFGGAVAVHKWPWATHLLAGMSLAHAIIGTITMGTLHFDNRRDNLFRFGMSAGLGLALLGIGYYYNDRPASSFEKAAENLTRDCPVPGTSLQRTVPMGNGTNSIATFAFLAGPHGSSVYSVQDSNIKPVTFPAKNALDFTVPIDDRDSIMTYKIDVSADSVTDVNYWSGAIKGSKPFRQTFTSYEGFCLQNGRLKPAP